MVLAMISTTKIIEITTASTLVRMPFTFGGQARVRAERKKPAAKLKTIYTGA